MQSFQKKMLIGITVTIVVITVGRATSAGQSPRGGPLDALQSALSSLQSQVTSLTGAVVALQNQTAASQVEIWRLGQPGLNFPTSQLSVSNYVFPSHYSGFGSGIINAFDTIHPDPKRVRRLLAVVSGRTGVYGQGMNLAIEARGFDGTLHRVLSTTSVDLETVGQMQWFEVPITNSSDAVITPGEYLASHVTLGGPVGGSLTLRLHLRAEVVNP